MTRPTPVPRLPADQLSPRLGCIRPYCRSAPRMGGHRSHMRAPGRDVVPHSMGQSVALHLAAGAALLAAYAALVPLAQHYQLPSAAALAATGLVAVAAHCDCSVVTSLPDGTIRGDGELTFVQGSINKGALVGGTGRNRNARRGRDRGTRPARAPAYAVVLADPQPLTGAAPVTRVLKPRSVIPAGRAGVWGGGGASRSPSSTPRSSSRHSATAPANEAASARRVSRAS